MHLRGKSLQVAQCFWVCFHHQPQTHFLCVDAVGFKIKLVSHFLLGEKSDRKRVLSPSFPLPRTARQNIEKRVWMLGQPSESGMLIEDSIIASLLE